jgi:hypothetical protein
MGFGSGGPSDSGYIAPKVWAGMTFQGLTEFLSHHLQPHPCSFSSNIEAFQPVLDALLNKVWTP